MKKRKKRGLSYVVLLLLVVFSSFVSANTYLTQNSTWGSNMTGTMWASIALGDKKRKRKKR